MTMAEPSAPRTPPLTPDRQNHVLVLAVVLLAISAARLLALIVSKTDLGFDEAQYWAWSQTPDFGYFTKPPLIAWMIGGVTALCGDNAVCIRLPAIPLHLASAVLIYLLGRRLYDWTVGFWAAIAYAIIPAVSVSSFLITTDVPLILCWLVAMIALQAHVRSPRIGTGLLLGLAIGIGLNAKYAMVFFLLSTVLYVATTRSAWKILRAPSTWLAPILGTVLLAPNLIWNMANGFATFDHTINDNMEVQGFSLHASDALEFIGTQFGMLGPIVFGAYLVILFTGRRTDRPASDRFLLFMSAPVFVLIVGQALMARAEANWSATAFPAAVLLTTAHLLLPRNRLSFRLSFAINAAVAAIILVGFAAITPTMVPVTLKPIHQLFGADAYRAELLKILEPTGVNTVVVRNRRLTAETIYALRGTGLEVRALLPSGMPPSNDFESRSGWKPETEVPAVVLTEIPRKDSMRKTIVLPGKVSPLGTIEEPSLRTRYTRIYVWKVEPGEPGEYFIPPAPPRKTSAN